MTGAPQPLGGIYGKTPAFGDFVHRRLPMTFVRPWDEWLSGSISASRRHIAERWTEAYLSSPPWRFALDPGIAGPAGWIGVFASSVDEVRRCYPIMVALPSPPGARLSDLSGDLEAILVDLERTALQLIAGELTPDAATATLDELARLLPASAFSRSALSRGGRECLEIDATYPSIAMMSMHLTRPSGESEALTGGLSVWWHGLWNSMPSASLVVAGLPSPDIFSCFLDGAWRERGWSNRSSRRMQ
jgi:type VI secretion system protein ImpM